MVCSQVSRGILPLFVSLSLVFSTGCSTHSSGDVEFKSFQGVKGVSPRTNLTPEEAEEALNDVGKNFLFGDGLGTAVLNLGTTVAFPPYGLFLLGNFALSASGYEPLGVGMFLEGEDEEVWDSLFSGFVSGPGRMAAALSGDEYRSPDVTRSTLDKYINPGEIDGVMGDY